ncbi:MAG: tetratricopeptide repeat protein [Pseudomonadota bacterium]
MPLFKCGTVIVDTARREMTIDGNSISIERRAFDLLAYLMASEGRVVEKAELLDKVWAGRPVSESTVAQAVSRARRALGGEGPESFIATAYGVGYRFVQPVERLENGADQSTITPEKPAGRSGWLWAIALTALVVASLAVWINRPSSRSAEPIRIAVLPVRNDTGDVDLEWARLGIPSLMDESLADAGVTRVRPGTVLATLRRYPDATDPEEQARLLRLSTGADSVLVPRLSKDGDGLRLDIQPVEARGDLPPVSLYGEDVALLAVAAAQSLSERLSRWQGAQRAQSSLVTDDVFVNEAFARGLDARLRGRHEDAARYFDTVLAAAPDLLEAKYHLSLVVRFLGDYDYTDQLNKELLAAAEASGNVSMLAAVQSVSGILAWRRGDKDTARVWYNQSLENYRAENNADYIASVTANLGILAATSGQYQDAEVRFLEALEYYQQSGDRFNEATALKNLGNLYTDQSRYGEAEAVLEESLELRRQLELPLQVALTMSVLADIKMVRGYWAEALTFQERVLAAAQEYDNPVLEAQASSDLAAAMRRLGRLSQAREMAAQARSIAAELGNPSSEADALLQGGRVERAMHNFGRAIELFAAAAELAGSIQEPLSQATSQIALAQTLLDDQRADEAATVIAEAESVIADSEISQLAVDLQAVQARLALERGDTATAVAQIAAAYQEASGQESPITAFDIGGLFGQWLLSFDPSDARLKALAEELSEEAQSSADALAFLVRYHDYHDNPTLALDLAMRRQRLLGEGWLASDEQQLQGLRQALAPTD